MPKRKKSSLNRRRAAAQRKNHISPERRAMLASPVGVTERMELDAMGPDVWLPRILNDPTISADTKAYAKQLAAKSDEQGGRIPDELFEA